MCIIYLDTYYYFKFYNEYKYLKYSPIMMYILIEKMNENIPYKQMVFVQYGFLGDSSDGLTEKKTWDMPHM